MKITRFRRLRGFAILAQGLEELHAGLPHELQPHFSRRRDQFDFEVLAPTPQYRSLHISATPDEIELSFGKLWTEGLAPDPTVALRILAVCDAIIAGRVREVRDLNTGLIFHVFRLRTRDLREYTRDSQYSVIHYLKLKVGRMRVTRVPPLVQA